MLSRDSWVRYTESLSPGQWQRVEHDCGPGRVLRVEATDDGFKAWCFRCSEGDGFRVEVDLATRLARLAALRQGDDAAARDAVGGALPVPQVRAVCEWPDGAAAWLYKAGLGRAEIGRLGVYYHPPSDRVVLPVPGPAGPVFWQARAWQPGRSPKYLGPAQRPANLLARWGEALVPTLTEDMLSAVKVGMVAEGWAIMGTSVSPFMLAELLRRGGKVNVWTDPDAAGRKAASKITKQLRAFGLEVRNILSERDPKLHHLSEIKEVLCGPSPSCS